MSLAPSPAPDHAASGRATLARIMRGLRMLTVPFPHLTGLAAAVRVDLDERVPTMGIFASGRLVANPGFTDRLSNDDLLFVLAHELLHLALRTHDRAVGSSRLEFNYAHDYIINDMLRHALGLTQIPAGGLDMFGARERSAEEIVLEMRRNGKFAQSRSAVWEGVVVTVEQALGEGKPGGAGDPGDVLDAGKEREMFPGAAEEQEARERAVRDLARRGMEMAKAIAAMRGRGTAPGSERRQIRALRGVHRAPWQVALQRWMEGVAPAERTFLRASRRGADHHGDMVLPGRQRSTLMLNVVLDTSASMTGDIPFALGALADFCEAVDVDEIRLLQCDVAVTADETLSPTELAEYEVKGYGGSDLTAALVALADDPRVTAVIVITDGDISFPTAPMPYAVLWAVPGDSTYFSPPYGRVVSMPKGSAA